MGGSGDGRKSSEGQRTPKARDAQGDSDSAHKHSDDCSGSGARRAVIIVGPMLLLCAANLAPLPCPNEPPATSAEIDPP